MARRKMTTRRRITIFSAVGRSRIGVFATLGVLSSLSTLAAADTIHGQVLGVGAPIVGSTVTLWAADTGVPTQLAQTRTGDDGRFALNADGGGLSRSLHAFGIAADRRRLDVAAHWRSGRVRSPRAAAGSLSSVS